MLVCQWFIAFMFAFGLFHNLFVTVNGSESKKGTGFTGVVVVLVFYAVFVAIYAKAGAFSLLLGAS